MQFFLHFLQLFLSQILSPRETKSLKITLVSINCTLGTKYFVLQKDGALGLMINVLDSGLREGNKFLKNLWYWVNGGGGKEGKILFVIVYINYLEGQIIYSWPTCFILYFQHWEDHELGKCKNTILLNVSFFTECLTWSNWNKLFITHKLETETSEEEVR